MTDGTATRAELVKMLDGYLGALASNDPGAVNAEGARFTENGQHLPLGKGLWATATREPAPQRLLTAADPSTGQAGCFALVAEAGLPQMLALRVKVTDGRITEAETMAPRNSTLFDPEGFTRPRTVWEKPLGAGEATPREALARIQDQYLDGILQADGSLIPVADDCARFENGVQTVLNPDGKGIREEARDRGTWHLGVRAQVDLGIFTDIEDARERRVPVIDEELGIVMGFFCFDHAGPVTARGGESRFRTPNTMPAAEMWKVVAGQIKEIESIIDIVPYGMRPGWE